MSSCALLTRYGLSFLFFVTLARAQSANTADLTGSVRDASGAAMPKVEVVATNRDTGAARKATTQEGGFYRVPSLPAGRYGVRAARQGFAEALRDDVVLEIGAVATVNLTLAVASQTQAVSVSAGAPMVEAERASVGTVVNRFRRSRRRVGPPITASI